MNNQSDKRTRPEYELYDGCAEAYDNITGQGHFLAVAADLVAALRLSAGERVLDIGAGTGAVCTAALQAVAPGGSVAAVDLSADMLERIRGGVTRAVGEMPGLPYHDEAFDAVCASFVMSHVQDCAGALRDMARVVRVGGRVGITSWGDATHEADSVFAEVASRFVDIDALRAASKECRPWQVWLAEPDNLRSALTDAGLDSITVETRTYETDITIEQNLAQRSTLLSGRFIRQSISTAEWEHFKSEVVDELRRAMGDRIRATEPVHIAFGHRPS